MITALAARIQTLDFSRLSGSRLRDRGEEGVTAVEYGLMVALAVTIAAVAFGPLRDAVQNAFQAAADALNNARS
ncbi:MULTISPECIES: Flp family type IVb pilin [Thermomonospora]|nr:MULTISPECIES: Flp family type IVb pilin [Thermomonospora]PKK14780.1 MAG: Flp family type IVb pilin [Thermomonospora sp. CIF 1]